MACTSKARFMTNNLIQLTTNSITFSSEVAAFPGTNSLDDFRSNVWKAAGNFTITTANQNLYINDGSDKTAVLTVGSYASPTALCTEIVTQLNAVSSNWSCTYDSPAGSYGFTLSNTGSVTIKLSTTTNAIWDDIGFVTATDQTGTSFAADEQRNHTNESVTVDFGYRANVTFIGAIGDISENFTLSNDSVVTIEGNNVNDFTAPPLSVVIDVDESGAFSFVDLESGSTDTRYRYWRINIIDRTNVKGNEETVQIGNLYLGDSIELTRNVQNNFTFIKNDPSSVSQSQQGVLYFDQREKFDVFSDITFFFVERSDKDTFVELYNRVGLVTPFYFSLDPGKGFSTNISDLTKYVLFSENPELPHEQYENFSIDLSLREVV